MNFRLRFVPALLVAALLTLPGISSEGGENAGGTGVWILPRPAFVCAGAGDVAPTSPPLAISTLTNEVRLVTSTELGSMSATLVDSISGSPLPLPITGRDVVLSRAVLQGLAASGTTEAHIVVADAQQLGYVFKLSIDTAGGSATLTLR